jgi:hypothetical protein
MERMMDFQATGFLAPIAIFLCLYGAFSVSVDIFHWFAP